MYGSWFVSLKGWFEALEKDTRNQLLFLKFVSTTGVAISVLVAAHCVLRCVPRAKRLLMAGDVMTRFCATW